jgi:hypothetical protein
MTLTVAPSGITAAALAYNSVSLSWGDVAGRPAL